jgi:hypothetical protein
MVASQRVRARRSLNSRAASGAGARRQGAGSVTKPAPGRYFSGIAERDRVRRGSCWQGLVTWPAWSGWQYGGAIVRPISAYLRLICGS